MPYRSNRELPAAVKTALPEHAQTIFRNVFNSQVSAGKPETVAFQSAWGALKNGGWEKQANGKWIKVSKANFVPPQNVRDAAARGLELRRKHGRGGLDTRQAGAQGVGSGVARARDLSTGKAIPLSTIKRMKSFFARHDRNKNNVMPDGSPSAGAIAWLLWGGTPGKEWVDRVLNGVEKAMTDFSIQGSIEKLVPDQCLVFGWASVIEDMDGEVVVDTQGDVIRAEELEKSAYDFVHNVRLAGEMHKTVDGVGHMVESVVLTKEKQQALGITPGSIPVGWWVGFKLSEDAFDKVKKGDYKMFSIGGSGQRTEMDDGEELLKDGGGYSEEDFGGGCSTCGFGVKLKIGVTCAYCNNIEGD